MQQERGQIMLGAVGARRLTRTLSQYPAGANKCMARSNTQEALSPIEGRLTDFGQTAEFVPQ